MKPIMKPADKQTEILNNFERRQGRLLVVMTAVITSLLLILLMVHDTKENPSSDPSLFDKEMKNLQNVVDLFLK